MKDTIKAKSGYSVSYCYEKCSIASHTNKVGYLYDGDDLVMRALYRSFEDFIDEKKNNECFVQQEVFTTVCGTQFVYWSDSQFNLDYLTIIKDKNNKMRC